MKVILRQPIESLGEIGDIVEVKDGYALNYLIPRKYAYLATKGNIQAMEKEKMIFAKKKEQEVRSAERLASELDNVSITLPFQVGEEDKIFGTVTTQMIADALKEKNYDIDKRKIEIPEQIKSLGIYSVDVKLHPNVTGKIKVWVVRE